MHWRLFLGLGVVALAPRSRSYFAPVFCGCCSKFGLLENFPNRAIAARDCECHENSVIIPGGETGASRCSRSACVEVPEWQIVWRNPKIHEVDRRKIWLSCLAHREYFEGYLSQRGFPVRAEAIGEKFPA